MSSSERQQTRPGVWLAEDVEQGWEPFEIIYTRYTRDPANPDRVIAAPGSYVVCPGPHPEARLREFLKERLEDAPLPGPVCTRKKHCEDPRKDKPLPIDIYVGLPSYIVIELDQSTGWTFKKNHPGITAAADYGPTNGALRHVRRNAPDDGPEGPTGGDCRIIYFRATRPVRFQHQQFHCHIDFNGLVTDPETIDPDIPNDGGKFPLSNPSPCNGGRCGYEECDGAEEA